MARSSSRYPTELELEILKVLWREGPASVRQVRDSLRVVRDLAHTSVMTIMGIMTEKGYLKRSKKGRGYVYTPLLSEQNTMTGMMGDLVDRVFNGSAAAAMVHLLETQDLNDAELSELKNLIREKTKEVK
ncbi:MAG: BlaI/MecI/CopY family transcriptional regulator [Sedimentisphaerales bacterium]|nr:BlaI/MecI/CopY family transcriptional regulator [Sedimentisphaerales bacterium]